MKSEYKTVKVEVKDGVAVLALNNPPVNQLSEHFVLEMADAILEAFKDPAIAAVVLTGTGKNFIAGADITEVQKVTDKAFIFGKVLENNKFLNAIEEGPKPVIAAINGHCLGGGLEIAMASHYRVAAAGVQVGQPEVQIGLIPGAGGTQRLPRLVGLADGLQMITTGQGIPAEEGLKKGCIDEVVAPAALLEKALEVAKRFFGLGGHPRIRLEAQDARWYLQTVRERFDVIAIDLYVTGHIPFFCTTREFFQLAHDRLTDRGLIMMNVLSIQPGEELIAPFVRTVRTVFPSVFLIGFGNYILVASKAPVDEAGLRRILRVADGPPVLREVAQRALPTFRTAVAGPEWPVYTDDLNDVEFRTFRMFYGQY